MKNFLIDYEGMEKRTLNKPIILTKYTKSSVSLLFEHRQDRVFFTSFN
jgi:hypothetical protein